MQLPPVLFPSFITASLAPLEVFLLTICFMFTYYSICNRLIASLIFWAAGGPRTFLQGATDECYPQEWIEIDLADKLSTDSL